MNVEEIMKKLAKLGSAQTKKTLMNHGAPEPLFGVKIGDFKPLQKAIKKDYQLSLALFETGNADAQYLAGLIADGEKMTKSDLKKWARQASWHMIGDFIVSGVAAESRYGWELALEWLKSSKENIASTGWATLGCLVSIKPDDQLDIKHLQKMVQQIPGQIHDAANRVRYNMNGFLVASGCFVEPLTEAALKAAKQIGKVEVDMGQISCQVPDAVAYIEKVKQKGRIGIKRKSAIC